MSIQIFETRPSLSSLTPGGLEQTVQERDPALLGAAAGDYEYNRPIEEIKPAQVESDAQVYDWPHSGDKTRFYRGRLEDAETELATFNQESSRIEQQLATLRRDRSYLLDTLADLESMFDTNISTSKVATSSLKTQAAVRDIDLQLGAMTEILSERQMEAEHMYEQLIAPAKAKHEAAETKEFEDMSKRSSEVRAVGSVAMNATILRLPSF